MKKSIVALLLMFMGIACASQNASAQTATYNWSITNTATGIVVGQFDVPTETGLSNAPFITPFSNIGNGQIATASATTTASSVTGTAFVGLDIGAPFDHEFECAFTITNSQVTSNGVCTAPTPSATATFGTSSTRPACGFSAPVQSASNPCEYTVSFTWGFQ
jgi:hypothetical protein